jgi:hypothetical protein
MITRCRWSGSGLWAESAPTGAGELAVTDDIRDQDCRALAALAHPSGTPALRMSSMIRSRRFK